MSTQTPGATDPSVDATPHLDPATFDADAWISGVTSTVRAVTLYQRADLMGRVDELERALRIAKSIPEEDRSFTDPSVAAIEAEMEQVARDFEASGITFKVQGRSDDWREKVEKRLKKQGVTDDTEIVIHQLAESILEPANITVEFLRQLHERSEVQLKMLFTAFGMANFQPPKVDVDFGSRSSSGRRRDRSS